MNQLNPSIYLALNNYQESYEFYRTRQESAVIMNLKIIQDFCNHHVNNCKITS